MSVLPTQEEIDVYYEEKKKEVAAWVVEYANGLKRVTKTQKSIIFEYANELTFSNVGELNYYVQELNTVSQRDKKRLFEYLSEVEWLPDGVNSGVLDGQYVTRVLESPLDKIFGKQGAKIEE